MEDEERVVGGSLAPPPLIPVDVWTVATSRWINNHVRNSPIAQSTEAWNHLGVVLQHLYGLLEDELKQRS
jgi:hypothetical protein